MFNYYYNKRRREARPAIVNSNKLEVQLNSSTIFKRFLPRSLAIPQERRIKSYYVFEKILTRKFLVYS